MRRALLSLIFLVVLSSVAYADPLVITGGTANIAGPAGGLGANIGSFNLLAPGFSATGTGDRNSANGLTNIHGGSRFNGGVMNNGTVLGGVFNDQTILSFVLAPFTPPDPNSSAATAIVSTAFTMTGNLTLVAVPGQTVLFSMTVAGSGFVSITYARPGPGEGFIPTNVAYTFGATQPVPEPATLTLLGAGLAGLAAQVRRKRTATRGA